MNRLYSYFTGKVIYILIGFAVLATLSGLFDTIIGPDAALSVSISKTNITAKKILIYLSDEQADHLVCTGESGQHSETNGQLSDNTNRYQVFEFKKRNQVVTKMDIAPVKQ
jgi:hypothetical protein